MSRIKNYLINKGWSDDQLRALHSVREFFFHINWLKTIWFNFKALPTRQAIKLPFIIGRNVKVGNVGKIIFQSRATIGMVSIAVIRINGMETNSYQTLFNNDGTFIFKGRAKFHPGAKISIFPNAVLTFGNRVSIGSLTKIVCSRQIILHDDIRMSWNGQMFDTDFHFLTNVNKNKVHPRQKPVEIESEVFIGNSCTIGKGTYIPKGSVISCCSKVSGNHKEDGENLLIVGNPGKVIAQGFKMGNSWFPEIEGEIAKNFGE